MNTGHSHAGETGGAASVEFEAICGRFETAWNSDQRPSINDFLEIKSPLNDSSSRRHLLIELVMIDMERRWRAASKQSSLSVIPDSPAPMPGEPIVLPNRPLLEDYVAGFADLGPLDLLPEDLIVHEYRVRHSWGDRPRHTEYLARYGAKRPALVRLLSKVDRKYRPTQEIPSRKITLTVIRGPHFGKAFTFERHESFVVGRGAKAHFRLPKKDPFFSRYHFIVEVNPPHCLLVDLDSTNGTRVNSTLVTRTFLNHGDEIRAGKSVLLVEFMPPPEKIVDAASLAVKEISADPGLESTRSYRLPCPVPDRELPEGGAKRKAPVVPQIPGYEILHTLGQGGMGVVYLAKRVRDDCQVALKLVQPAVAAPEYEVEFFLREADILRQLRHPRIVSFLEMGHEGDHLYFAMEYVPGTDGSRLLQTHGPLPIGRAVGLVCQALGALQYAHDLGFVHRDVKPANLLVGGSAENEVCKLADFGLARAYQASSMSGLTMVGDVGGTLPYMPPEQITHYRDAKPPADQYAVAATLYRLLTGHHLFELDDSNEERLMKILCEEPVPLFHRRPDVPAGLCKAIHRALEKEPEDRFPDAAAFRDALLPLAANR